MREALKLALEALEVDAYVYNGEKSWKAITAIKEALAQPEQEPVAWPCVIAEAEFSENTITLTMQCTDYKVSAGKHWLSTTPPQRTWVGLSREDCYQVRERESDAFMYGVAWAEAKLKEKNT